jgi:SnoaL-like polyketide cyclase
MSAEENKAIFIRFMRELGKSNLAIIDEVCSADFAFHSPNFPGWPRGLEGARTLSVAGRSMFSDAQTKLDDIFAADDKVAYDLLVPTETTNAEQSWSAAQGVIYKVSKSEIGAFLRLPIRVET